MPFADVSWSYGDFRAPYCSSVCGREQTALKKQTRDGPYPGKPFNASSSFSDLIPALRALESKAICSVCLQSESHILLNVFVRAGPLPINNVIDRYDAHPRLCVPWRNPHNFWLKHPASLPNEFTCLYIALDPLLFFWFQGCIEILLICYKGIAWMHAIPPARCNRSFNWLPGK